jgi:hypothetical protein
MKKRKGKFLLDKDIVAPSILVLITKAEPRKRKLIFVSRKTKGSLTEAYAVMAIDIEDLKKNPRLLLKDPAYELGQRLYLPNGQGGHHKGISRFELPTSEELAACKKIFDDIKEDLKNPVIKIQLPNFEEAEIAA